MSFFGTEEAHIVGLANVTDKGGRVAPRGLPSPPPMDICKGDGRPPGSSVKSMLRANAQFGAKKDIHILGKALLGELNA